VVSGVQRVLDPAPAERAADARDESPPPGLVPDRRVRVDGKFFSRGGGRFRVQGVTYGPFAPDAAGRPFPAPSRVVMDFVHMRGVGVNAVRTYHVPPEWFLDLADEHEIAVYIDVPWAKHLCFLDSAAARRGAREAVRAAAVVGSGRASVLAYSIGNEIPPGVVRWHGARRVERFLAELRDAAKQADPETSVTYASYPPTEFLDLSFFDFATFNVYLHDPEAFRRYLFRLQNLVGDRPLLLGELGMDTLRHGEEEQAQFLGGHVREARLMGLAGTFVFAWTDEWYTGGHPIQDWAFGVTHADRFPKAACHALREAFDASPASLLEEAPRVSVVVCTYNGGTTLDQCIRSLLALDYPDYEVIVVDDGSMDDTREILSRFPSARAVHQPNRGLSVARNVGLREATGAIVAYTDSDCFADPDWLTHLVHQLKRSGAAAVGGPNLTPDDGALAACVAAAPGQPTHVLEGDETAEHIPGCNMAFRREALEAINGFDPQYRKAGDDVDVCWRLQHAGFLITFAPGAFVWHHRRQNPRAYLRQQAGYGEAEALLQFKHPARFNGRGEGKWRGVLYGASLRGLRFGGPIIYRGVFASGLFQCLYQPSPSHWAMLPSTLEWQLAAALLALAGFFWPLAWAAAGAMLALSLGVAALQAYQASLPREHDGWLSRTLVAWLCYAQPLVRSSRRYRTRLFSYSPPAAGAPPTEAGRERPLLGGARTLAYWGENGIDRTELVGLFAAHLLERRWGTTIDSGWSDWDLEVHGHSWTLVQVCTAQEEHGSGRLLVRVRYRLRFSPFARASAVVVAGAAAAAALLHPAVGAVAVSLLALLLAGAWLRGARLAARMVEGFDGLARGQGLVRCGSKDEEGPGTRGAGRVENGEAT
jgi:O-antigen biosynthesis protein